MKRPRERGDTGEEGGNVVGDVGNDVGDSRGNVDGGGDEGKGRIPTADGRPRSGNAISGRAPCLRAGTCPQA